MTTIITTSKVETLTMNRQCERCAIWYGIGTYRFAGRLCYACHQTLGHCDRCGLEHTPDDNGVCRNGCATPPPPPEMSPRDYAQEVHDRMARESMTRDDVANLLVQMIETTAEPVMRGDLRLKEWRMASGDQTELMIQRPDGMTISITIKTSEKE